MRISSVLAVFVFLSVCAAPGSGAAEETAPAGVTTAAATQQPVATQSTTRSGGSGRWGMQFLGPDTIADVIEGAEPFIVNIACNNPGAKKPQTPEEVRRHKRFFGDLPGDESYTKLAGTGVIVRSDGVILTSLHVVDGQAQITVTLHDKRTFPAKILNRDSFYDLAAIKIDATGLPTAKFADVNQLRKGEWVIAIGNQLGLDSSVTLGLISGIGREVKGYTAYGARTGAVRFIQTDASVNPGSSGGPLINLRGEVVGINTFIREDAQNVGFAIPANLAQDVATKLSTTSPIKHPFIGIEMVEPDPAAAAMGMAPAAKGVQVSTVRPFGPASNAGLLPGDVITQIDGMAVSRPDDVSEAVARVSVGQVLKVDIRRGNAQKHLDVRVEALPDDG